MPDSAPQNDRRNTARRWLLLAMLPALLHAVVPAPAEPVFNGDEIRHTMTSVFFRDFLVDQPLDAPREYVTDYYQQYPALGLLIWPPLFHGVSGLLMTVFGTSVWVPRTAVFGCFLLSAVCLYRLCRRRLSVQQSETTVLIYSLMPMIFVYSRHAMLEMPTLALCMVSIERFDIWLKEQRTRNLYIAAVSAAMAALTRFDAVVLLPTLLLLAVVERLWKRLLNIHVPMAAIVAVMLIAPTYYVIWHEMGSLHMRQATENVSGTAGQMLAPGALWYYPSHLPVQTGWPIAVFVAIGLLAVIRRQHRAALGIFAAIVVGTYLTFTPLAEMKPRHAIYWLPAIAWFACVGMMTASDVVRNLWAKAFSRKSTATAGFLTTAVLLVAAAWTTFHFHVYRLTGYRQAADVVLQKLSAEESVLVDGWWEGNLTYHLRHLDPTRSRHVVRADKLLYDFTNVPNVDFQLYVETDTDILKTIADASTRCVVLEDPQPFGTIAVSERMKSLIMSMPEQFPPLDVIPVTSTVPMARPFVLRVFEIDQPKLQAFVNQLPTTADDQSNQVVPDSATWTPI